MRFLIASAVLVATLAWSPPPVRAGDCLDRLEELGVHFQRARRRGLSTGVIVVDGRLGGIEYRGYKKGGLVIDCSLAYSLARVGPMLSSLGIERVVYSSAYQRRKIRGTSRLSRHSYGLAIDIHTFSGEGIGTVKIKDDYEQGLGDLSNCIGEPLTRAGRLLRLLDCGLDKSGLFRVILSPDFDADHYNHLHVEVLPWDER